MKSVLIAVLTLFLVFGCAGRKPQPPRTINPRIIYRDLTQPADEKKKKSNAGHSIINGSVLRKSFSDLDRNGLFEWVLA
jgi:hypothetical protein